jgi:Bacterial PH domain
MKTPSGYRLRRSRLLTNLAAALLVAAAAGLAVAIAADAIEAPLGVTEIIISGLVPVILITIAVWPVRVLDLTSRSLRFRERLVMVPGRSGRQPIRTGLREVAWSDVAEVLLASHRGRVTMIVGFRAPGPVLHAAVVDLPVRDEEAVARAISTIAPGIVVRRGRLPELLTHTRLPYATGQARIGTQVLGLVLSGLAFGTTIVLFNLLTGLTYGVVPGVLFLLSIRTWFASPPLFVSPERISLRKGCRTRTVPWTAVASVSSAAEGDGAELRVQVGQARGRLAAGTVLTRRVPRRSDLADLDEIIRAYAPPQALNRRLPTG